MKILNLKKTILIIFTLSLISCVPGGIEIKKKKNTDLEASNDSEASSNPEEDSKNPEEASNINENTDIKAGTCYGAYPSGAMPCSGSTSGLTENIKNTFTSAQCGQEKCQYHCPVGTQLRDNQCLPIPAPKTSPSISSPPVVFYCLGEVPPNSTMCGDDSNGLAQNTNRSVKSSCNDAYKCEYTCNSEYTLIKGECILSPPPPTSTRTCPSPNITCEKLPAPSYSCQGGGFNNARMCNYDANNLTKDTNTELKTSCTDTYKCEYICNSGYSFIKGECILSPPPTPTCPSPNITCEKIPEPSYSCQGGGFNNARMCNYDANNLIKDTNTELKTSCTDTYKCEYICNSGYSFINGVCALKIETVPPVTDNKDEWSRNFCSTFANSVDSKTCGNSSIYRNGACIEYKSLIQSLGRSGAVSYIKVHDDGKFVDKGLNYAIQILGIADTKALINSNSRWRKIVRSIAKRIEDINFDYVKIDITENPLEWLERYSAYYNSIMIHQCPKDFYLDNVIYCKPNDKVKALRENLTSCPVGYSVFRYTTPWLKKLASCELVYVSKQEREKLKNASRNRDFSHQCTTP